MSAGLCRHLHIHIVHTHILMWTWTHKIKQTIKYFKVTEGDWAYRYTPVIPALGLEKQEE